MIVTRQNVIHYAGECHRIADSLQSAQEAGNLPPEQVAAGEALLTTMVARLWGYRETLSARRAAAIGSRRQARPGECPRCGGRGVIRAYSHVKNGTCFACKGTGKPPFR